MNRLAEPSQKVTLNERELAFVEAYASPPWPTIEDAAKTAGYAPGTGRHVKRKPHIITAIAERVAEHQRDDARGIAQVKEVLRKKAVGEIPSDDPERNADLFLEAVGLIGRGVKIVNNVTAVASDGDGFADRLREVARSRISADLTRAKE